MKILILSILGLLASGSLCSAAGRRYTISDIANPDAAEDNAFAINENLRDLYNFKVDVDSANPITVPQYIIADLDDPDKADLNAFAINESLDDLWRHKVDSFPPGAGRRFVVGDLANPDESDDNSFKINEMFDDLWREKKDLP